MGLQPIRGLRGRARFSNRLTELHAMHHFVRGLAIEAGFLDHALGDIELAVVEACANVVKHAYRNQTEASAPVDIEVWVEEVGLWVVITDRGEPFEPPGERLSRPDPAQLVTRQQRGGLGLYFIQNLMDEVTWDIRPGEHNRIRMLKRLVSS
jgi:serine/threonine-protein kinase RsbW